VIELYGDAPFAEVADYLCIPHVISAKFSKRRFCSQGLARPLVPTAFRPATVLQPLRENESGQLAGNVICFGSMNLVLIILILLILFGGGGGYYYGGPQVGGGIGGLLLLVLILWLFFGRKR
jgi:hypothetical protein